LQGRHGDNGSSLPELPPQQLSELPAVQPRQRNVEQHHVGLCLLSQPQRRVRVMGCRYLKAAAL
jgi:hypothetical protein